MSFPTDKPIVIGFSGKLGSGKNYIAEHILPRILDKHIVPIYLAYADQLKVEVYARDKTAELTYDGLYVNKTPEVRRQLQTYGTEIGRESKKNIWVDALHMWITVFTKRWARKDLIPVFIITDVRFVNEAEYILKQDGIIFRIDAPGRTEAKLRQEAGNDNEQYQAIKFHRSEISLDDFEFSAKINNDNSSDEEIINTLREVLISFNGIITNSE
jgi:hypothetical protein